MSAGSARSTGSAWLPVPLSPAIRSFASDVLVALLFVAGAAVARICIEQVVGGVAPFVLTFPAVMMATLWRGGRAGTMAAIGCQVLTIRFVFPNWIAAHGGITTELANVALSTASLGGIIWATASYRGTAAFLRSRCEHQIRTLSLLITEMDHRTKNNFQIAAGLLAHQSLSSHEPGLAQELNRAAGRLETIASVYQDIAMEGETRERVNLAEHVGRIVDLLRTGATPDHIALTFKGDDAVVTVEAAIILGLIANEWVTNALKHAFHGGSGRIQVRVVERWGRTELIVEDDGNGQAATRGAGRGSDMMTSLADIIGAKIAITHEGGTRCALSYQAW